MFYATVWYEAVKTWMPTVPVLLPASSWARKGLAAVKLPEHITERAADCGGFVATKRWGDYRYTPEQYVEWLYSFQPQWSATMDYCCEEEITGRNDGVVLERQFRTTEMAYYFWCEYRDAPWAWVPTVQGWHVEDYRRHARDLRPLIRRMQLHYGDDPRFRVGIGTLCARADTATIHAVVNAVASELPDTPLHLWGVKLTTLKGRVSLPQVVSVDSAAWQGMFATRREAWRASGMTQMEYGYRVRLPEYVQKIETALGQTKQAPLVMRQEEAS